MTTTWETTTVRHGTNSGWCLHKRIGERPCDPCRAAKAKYDRSRKKETYHAVMNRLSAAAQHSAYRALAAHYPTEYRALYEQAKARLLVERAAELDAARVGHGAPDVTGRT